MAKPELGTKRLCGHCGAKFYDLNKDPITCPKCGSLFQVAAPSARMRPEAAAAAGAAASRSAQADEVEAIEPGDAEFVSLEEADAEAQGKSKGAVDDAAVVDDDIELEETLEDDDDSTFIEEEEEDDEDVTGIIGGVDDEEES